MVKNSEGMALSLRSSNTIPDKGLKVEMIGIKKSLFQQQNMKLTLFAVTISHSQRLITTTLT